MGINRKISPPPPLPPWHVSLYDLETKKIVDKQAFWARVRSGKERADALAREVFCQTVLTRHNTDVDDSFDAISKREGVTSEARHGGSYNQPRFGCDCGGGIVRLHSVLETATELVRSKQVRPSGR